MSTLTKRTKKPSIHAVYETSANAENEPVSLMHSSTKAFPIEVLPWILRDYVREAAASIGCDSSYVVLPLLASIARVICNKRSIRLKPDWTEPAIIWGAIISDSGEYKTPALNAATRFLRQLQKSQPEITYFSDDVTFAALRDILAKQPDSALLDMPDELAEVFRGLGGRGENAAKKGHWLSAWSAKDMTVHRHKQTTVIPRAAVSIVGGIQPSTFRDLVLCERHIQDGMCARFLLTWQPHSQPPKWTKLAISFDANLALRVLFSSLVQLPAAFDRQDDAHYKPIAIPLSYGAEREWKDFYDRHNAEAYSLDRDLKAAWKKLEAYAARFALILQLVNWASKDSPNKSAMQQQISSDSMRRAIQLTEWFKREAKRVYALLNETSDDIKRRELIDLVRRNGGTVTANELRQKSRKYNSEQKATSALNDLVNQKLATRMPVTPGEKGGRPTSRYVLTI